MHRQLHDFDGMEGEREARGRWVGCAGSALSCVPDHAHDPLSFAGVLHLLSTSQAKIPPLCQQPPPNLSALSGAPPLLLSMTKAKGSKGHLHSRGCLDGGSLLIIPGSLVGSLTGVGLGF